MLKKLLVFGLVVGYGQVAEGQGDVRSYFVFVNGAEPTIVEPNVPSGGFVVTDISADEGSQWTMLLMEDGVVKTGLFVRLEGHHFTSGIPFAPGSEIKVDIDGIPANITISGYIPQTLDNVPAVGTWGLCVMVLLLLSAGTVVMVRRRATVAGDL